MSGRRRNGNRNLAAARVWLDSVASVGLLMRQANRNLNSWRAGIEDYVAGCLAMLQDSMFKFEARYIEF